MYVYMYVERKLSGIRQWPDKCGHSVLSVIKCNTHFLCQTLWIWALTMTSMTMTA